jgi:hypothetical protein
VTGQVLGGIGVPIMLDMGQKAAILYGHEVIDEPGVKDYRSEPSKGDSA